MNFRSLSLGFEWKSLLERLQIESTEIGRCHRNCIRLVTRIIDGLGDQCIELVVFHPVISESCREPQTRQKLGDECDGLLICITVREMAHLKAASDGDPSI